MKNKPKKLKQKGDIKSIKWPKMKSLGKYDVTEMVKASYPDRFKRLKKHRKDCECSTVECKDHKASLVLHIGKNNKYYMVCSIDNKVAASWEEPKQL